MKRDLENPALFPQARPLCARCKRAAHTCYCAQVRPFDCGPQFVLLVHPKEARNRVGTARIVELCIPGSPLIVGKGRDLDNHPRVRALVDDPTRHCLVLYPGKNATPAERLRGAGGLAPATPNQKPRRLTIFLIDGTWATANNMVKKSRVLQALPQLSLNPRAVSRYRFRRQPAALCLSTVEAVHQILEAIQDPQSAHARDNLLEVFDWMVELQLNYGKKHGNRRGVGNRHREDPPAP